MKTCRICHQEKSTEFFNKNSTAKDGFDSRCKECKQQIYFANHEKELVKRRQNYHNNKERYTEYFEQYRRENRDVIREREREFYQKNQPRIRAERAEFAAKYPETVKEWRKRERQKHREYYRQRSKRWNAANRAWHNAYQRSHPEYGRIKMHRRRIQKSRMGRGATVSQWRAMFDWFGGICQCCGSHQNITIDHVIPLVKNGSNRIENLQPLCLSCNSRKGANSTDYRHPIVLASFLEMIAA